MAKYLSKIKYYNKYYLQGEIPAKKLNVAIEKFDIKLDKNTIIGFYDNSIFGNGKTGYIFADTKLYYKESFEETVEFYYRDVISVEVVESEKDDTESTLIIVLNNGDKYEISDITVYKTPLCNFIKEMVDCSREDGEYSAIMDEVDNFVYDNIVIPSKYYKSTKDCINSYFDEDGVFKYIKDYNSIIIEVPKDQYSDVIKIMEEKYAEGNIQGITDCNFARKMIRGSQFIYEKVKNIAIIGKIENLKYDDVSGEVIVENSPFSVSGIILLAINIWYENKYNKSIPYAISSEFTITEKTFVSNLLTKSELESVKNGDLDKVETFIDPSVSKTLINIFSEDYDSYIGAPVYSDDKTLSCISSCDSPKIFSKISGKEKIRYFISNNFVIWGFFISIFSFMIFSKLIGTIDLLVYGSCIIAYPLKITMKKIKNRILANYFSSVEDKMMEILNKEFEIVAQEYLFNCDEGYLTLNKIREKIDNNLLEEMSKSQDTKKFARETLILIAEEVIKMRKCIGAIRKEDMIENLVVILKYK